MMAAAVLFSLCLFLGVYPYLIYPLLVRGLARTLAKPWRRGGPLPRLSLIISVYNEEKVIREKIENALALRYPAHRLEIVVVSDGSTDRTEEIAASFRDRRLVVRSYQRAGKTACLNRAVPAATGEIVVFTDANSLFPPDVLEKIGANFADPAVGLVTGWTRYRNEAGEEESSGAYARLEKVTKEAESLVASCVGADGAVFAMRKALFRPLRTEDINDFVLPLHVIGQGKRAVLDPDVYCFEKPAAGEGREFRRQVRITSRTLGALARNGRFLDPCRYGWFAFFLLSHKLLRFLVPFFLAGTCSLSLWLAGRSVVFAAFAVAHLLFVGFGAMAWCGGKGGRPGQLCAAFLLTISAQLIGWARWATGKSDVTWTPQH